MRLLFVSSLLLATLLTPGPAFAAYGGDRAAFEHFLHRVPKSQWKLVPDSADAGVLYAGRIGSLATIVRVYFEQGRVVRQKVEVALPTETNDEFALAILTRFMSEFVRHPEELKPVMNTMRAMRRTLLGTGRRSTELPYRDALYTLSLDSSTNEFNSKTIEVPWGMLYWKAEAVSNRPAKKKR
ncbi:MAG TPA: hypothetical protein V6D05_17180 [Stenomitos sp.]